MTLQTKSMLMTFTLRGNHMPPPSPPETNFSAVGLLGFLSFLALMQVSSCINNTDTKCNAVYMNFNVHDAFSC